MKAEFTASRRAVLASGAGVAAALVGAPDVVLAQVAQGTVPSRTAADAAGAPASVDAAEAAVARHAEAILRISREVWALAELSVLEVDSARVHLRELEAAGFRTVSTGTSGYPTAFVSEWSQGAGGPVIALLPEYDALPGLGNAAEPRQTPSPNGRTEGHGCGHNMLGAGCTGAAFALKAMMEAAGAPGAVRVYGCASEEAQGAKVYFARDGLFDDVDAALAWHPAPFAAVGEVATSANMAIKIRFNGRTAHAGNTPWDGRSALKAAELFGAGLQFMREHVLPTTRLHYVYESAGVAPNIVPDFAQVWLTIRAANGPDLKAVVDWARQIAEGAALMTQTAAAFEPYYGMHEILPNAPMIGLLHSHMAARPPVWTEAEQDFAKACQREMGLPEAGLATAVAPPLPPTKVGGSSDLGDISKVTPLGAFAWPTAGLGTSLHTWAITACGGMSIGDRAALDTARILAGAGFDLMTDPDLRAAARADLARRMGGEAFVPLLPADRVEPLGLPDWLRKTGLDELTAFDPGA
ncbi:amidohydrolase [Rubrimonas sp.]|uniref:amidohydrolase n=1 Tax=Rubrimonas sp. TaxID=2036015 RepID=UPI002FDDC3A7